MIDYIIGEIHCETQRNSDFQNPIIEKIKPQFVISERPSIDVKEQIAKLADKNIVKNVCFIGEVGDIEEEQRHIIKNVEEISKRPIAVLIGDTHASHMSGVLSYEYICIYNLKNLEKRRKEKERLTKKDEPTPIGKEMNRDRNSDIKW